MGGPIVVFTARFQTNIDILLSSVLVQLIVKMSLLKMIYVASIEASEQGQQTSFFWFPQEFHVGLR